MGWYYPANTYTRKELIEELTRPSVLPNAQLNCLRSTTRGNVLWSVWETKVNTGETHRHIKCDLLVKSTDGWGYKPMSEECGPTYYTCPPVYLTMVPSCNEEWRTAVREHHNNKRKAKV